MTSWTQEHGSEAAVKAAGGYRQQGKNYIVEDGDIIFFKVDFLLFVFFGFEILSFSSTLELDSRQERRMVTRRSKRAQHCASYAVTALLMNFPRSEKQPHHPLVELFFCPTLSI